MDIVDLVPNPKLTSSICYRCRKEFRHPRNSKRKYCSQKCLYKNRSKETKGRKLKPKYKNGDTKITNQGYEVEYLNGKWEPKHRLVMEEILERSLIKGESVHHKDGIRSNNSKDNLELWIGGVRYGQRATELCCQHCGKPYLVA